MKTLSYKNTTLNDTYVGGAEGPYGNLDNFGRTGDSMPGLKGLEIEVDARTAVSFTRHFNTGNTFYQGRYQRVKTLLTSTATPARGTIAFFSSISNEGDIIVTPDMPTNPIIRGVYLATVTKGNWTWIQVEGLASVLFVAGGLATATAVGLPVFVESVAGVGRANNAAILSAFSNGSAIKFLGQQAEAAVTDTISRIILGPRKAFN